ncbi:dendritic cell-specific transmembrane protein [Hyla sarda]|uniref:dendritic cell-specific transmembrane protein n=1 Tax=Hyla sarda TaxID=327740 RepID=UPI0024C275F2|nr:dendritic cell-specific transmembrane protein [Hyla sarda]
MTINDFFSSIMAVAFRILEVLYYCKELFVLGREENGWKNRIIFAFLCWLFGMTISGCFSLVFFLSKVGLGPVTSMIAILVGMLLSILAFAFKSVRCNGLLFLLCCGMRQGRNVLIAIGTSIVLFNNVRNILGNLKVLADSIICNLDEKRNLLKVTPFDYYVKTLYALYKQAKGQFFNPLKDFVNVVDNFRCSVQISDEELKTTLRETRQQIQDLSSNILALLNGILFYGRIAFLILGVSIIVIGSIIFFRKFLASDNAKYENIYITKRFIKYDQHRKQQNMLCVLPLNKAERGVYMTIPSLKTSRKQKQKMVMFLIPVMTNVFIWCLISALDFMLYWLILTIGKNLQGLPPVDVPMSMTFTQLRIEELFIPRKTENVYETQMNFNVFEPQCTPEPQLSLTATWIPLAILIGVLLFLGLISAFLVQMKLSVIAAFYPDRAAERVTYLHNKILGERTLLLSSSKGRQLKYIISQVNFWFPIITRKHFIKKW